MDTHFTDTLGNEHITTKVLGQGGQGVVMRTSDPDLALKIVPDGTGDAPDRSPETMERMNRVFGAVLRLPIPEDCHITLPLVQLCDAPGYVMHLMNELSPMSSLWPSGSQREQELPVWLAGVAATSTRAANELLHYSRTGSLRRRLSICASCAAELARLHSRGLVYGDISLNNIFLGDDLEYPVVWLIDADNIRYEREGGGQIVYTPTYGAPELVQGRAGCSTVTDDYAFAVTVFRTLTLAHPFLGKAAESGGGDWADTVTDENSEDGEQKAYGGKLPWIFDPRDNSNAPDRFVLGPGLVFTRELSTLFERTFCAGRTNPAARPLIWHWAETLARAADRTLACPECGMSRYAERGPLCRYCGTPDPPRISMQSYHWRGDGLPATPAWQFEHELPRGRDIRIPARVFEPFDAVTTGILPLMTVRQDAEGILLTATEHMRHEMRIAPGEAGDTAFVPLPHTSRLPHGCRCFWLLYCSDAPYAVKVNVIPAGKEVEE